MDLYVWDIVIKHLIKLGYDKWIFVNRDTYIKYRDLDVHWDVLSKINLYYTKKYGSIKIKLPDHKDKY
jgi:hypothetical protein